MGDVVQGIGRTYNPVYGVKPRSLTLSPISERHEVAPISVEDFGSSGAISEIEKYMRSDGGTVEIAFFQISTNDELRDVFRRKDEDECLDTLKKIGAVRSPTDVARLLQPIFEEAKIFDNIEAAEPEFTYTVTWLWVVEAIAASTSAVVAQEVGAYEYVAAAALAVVAAAVVVPSVTPSPAQLLPQIIQDNMSNSIKLVYAFTRDYKFALRVTRKYLDEVANESLRLHLSA
ncbi:hypothetical protein [Alicyclobacillus sendaiensis]|uniref:Uncharacterized protein n=1 Tax=Alicyclobacillus sendaiensis PA2 TaxID=3029425 RepID=A0ABT6Y177_ALISE|nr:hypothetical protein [Alicyclobacillus sendaiensis]MDI9261096.1 hypothetical protein [Alicyclobacillus sendaiensis PA2]